MVIHAEPQLSGEQILQEFDLQDAILEEYRQFDETVVARYDAEDRLLEDAYLRFMEKEKEKAAIDDRPLSWLECGF